jgi:nucleoid-associated protein YgaU
MTTPTLSVGAWPGSARAATPRLTARGRAVLLVVLGLCAALASAALLVGLRQAAAPAAEGIAEATGEPGVWGAELAARGLARPHTVAAGDTLWGLATAIDPTGDPRPLVDRIQLMNGLSDSRLAVGETLWLPIAQG